uniref:Uncharacterized protein n=1 Tax=Anguilla anguilla TaxID=7936 RepID=A0A0E9X730_ANGAN
MSKWQLHQQLTARHFTEDAPPHGASFSSRIFSPVDKYKYLAILELISKCAM